MRKLRVALKLVAVIVEINNGMDMSIISTLSQIMN